MPAPTNHLKAAMAAGDVLRGPFMSLGSETAAEIAALAGFDFVLVDAEHGAFDPTNIRRQLIAIAAAGGQAAVRVPANEAWILKQVLDLGAQTVMVPIISSVQEAEAAVRACRYPPDGIRGLGGKNMRAGGYGATPDYAATANDQICIILQVENRSGLEQLEGICAVDGVDCVFIGPADLGMDMGFIHDLTAAPLTQAVIDATARIAATQVAAGVFASPDQQPALLAAGATVFGVGADSSALSDGFRALVGATI